VINLIDESGSSSDTGKKPDEEFTLRNALLNSLQDEDLQKSV
jgi:hypothetical protein